MNFRVALALGSLALVTVASGACSSKPATPRAYVDATIGAGGQGGACNVAGGVGGGKDFVLIGDNTPPHSSLDPLRIDDGSNQGGHVHITCDVKPQGSNYAIALSAELSTTLMGSGGSFTVAGTVSGDPTQPSPNISATFYYSGSNYVDNNCTITYDIRPANGPIAPGRIWGHLECPQALLQGSGTPVTCLATAEFVFENCGE